MNRAAHIAGMTVLELMIVLAIIGGACFLVRTGFRMLTKADLVEDSTELAAVHAAREPARGRARRASPRRARPRQGASTSSRSARAQAGDPAQREVRHRRGGEEARAREGQGAAAAACRPDALAARRSGGGDEARDRRSPGQHIADHDLRRRRPTPIDAATRTGKGWIAPAAREQGHQVQGDLGPAPRRERRRRARSRSTSSRSARRRRP